MKTLLFPLALALSVSAAPVMKCEDLASTTFGADVKIESAKLTAATNNLPEHCAVSGVIWPEARFIVKLPSNWNNRFQMVGNGGWAGTISTAAVDTAVRLGYASTSTDTGHSSQKEPGAIFAMKTAENPNAMRKVIDHGYLSVHETALLAKKMIRAYYGSDARYSYWVGCSTGGRQGLMEAQRYPEDFDGYVIGAPVLYLTGLQTKAVWNQIAMGPGPGEVKSEKFRALADSVYNKCDALDGLKDGIIENPIKCNFDVAQDLKKCAAGADTPDCFTAGQIAGLKIVYDGVRTSKNELLFPGFPVGGEAFTTDARGQSTSGWSNIAPSFNLGDTFMKYMAFEDPPGASWDYRTFNPERDLPRMTKVGLAIDARITDLTAVKARGAKIVHYHGWADPGVTANMSVNYYEAAKKTMGEKETTDFYRFFPVPGMFHCGGGPGCGNVDWLTAVVNWVEKGQAPEILVGAHVEAGQTTRTRPICMYPSEARYKGTGSIDAAENFSCGN